MTLDNRNSRIYSRLGQRGAIFGMAVNDAAANDERFLLLTADLATLSGMDRYVKTYPNQFLNAGIAEQNMVGMAAGLAAEGFHPVVTTYATFLTMRACEQIRHYMGYMHLPIIAIGSGAGLSQGFAGNTHYTIEDLSMMRAIPGLTIFSPADAGSAVKIFEMALSKKEPTYIRLTGNLNCPIVYRDDTDFNKGSQVVYGGSSSVLKADSAEHGLKTEGSITILACGTMVATAMQAAEILEQNGLTTTVVDMYRIKPIDEEVISRQLSAVSGQKHLFVTIEEHNTIGGLGAAVAEVLSHQSSFVSYQLLRLGIADTFDLASDYEGLLEQNRLTPEQIAEDIEDAYEDI